MQCDGTFESQPDTIDLAYVANVIRESEIDSVAVHYLTSNKTIRFPLQIGVSPLDR